MYLNSRVASLALTCRINELGLQARGKKMFQCQTTNLVNVYGVIFGYKVATKLSVGNYLAKIKQSGKENKQIDQISEKNLTIGK